jgi:hypothetical protein
MNQSVNSISQHSPQHDQFCQSVFKYCSTTSSLERPLAGPKKSFSSDRFLVRPGDRKLPSNNILWMQKNTGTAFSQKPWISVQSLYFFPPFYYSMLPLEALHYFLWFVVDNRRDYIIHHLHYHSPLHSPPRPPNSPPAPLRY